jgi:hypothetical protein
MDKNKLENDLLIWSDGMVRAAAAMLRRGENKEVITLRKLIAEWENKFESWHHDIVDDKKRTIESIQSITHDFQGSKAIPQSVINNIISTLKHARIFISSREKMHPDGIKLYDELLNGMVDFYGE